MDARVFSVTDYMGPNLWSSALHQAFPEVDGIYFISRLANEPSVAVFDRAKLVATDAPIPLHRFHLLPAFLDQNCIAIAAPTGHWTA